MQHYYDVTISGVPPGETLVAISNCVEVNSFECGFFPSRGSVPMPCDLFLELFERDERTFYDRVDHVDRYWRFRVASSAAYALARALRETDSTTRDGSIRFSISEGSTTFRADTGLGYTVLTGEDIVSAISKSTGYSCTVVDRWVIPRY